MITFSNTISSSEMKTYIKSSFFILNFLLIYRRLTAFGINGKYAFKLFNKFLLKLTIGNFKKVYFWQADNTFLGLYENACRLP